MILSSVILSLSDFLRLTRDQLFVAQCLQKSEKSFILLYFPGGSSSDSNMGPFHAHRGYFSVLLCMAESWDFASRFVFRVFCCLPGELSGRTKRPTFRRARR